MSSAQQISQLANRKDMTGLTFGRWTVVREDGRKNSQISWLCRCECGTEKSVGGYVLRSGGSKSCGCLSREVASARIPSSSIVLSTGDRFGEWTVLRRHDAPKRTSSSRHVRYECVCACGVERDVSASALITGRSHSCGCDGRNRLRDRSTTHGQSKTDVYRIWSGMWRRCRNKSDKDYGRYGARGITVCDRWLSFENFISDVGPRPSLEHSIGRIDNDGPYDPSNVRWETIKQQAQNKRTSRKLTFGGRTMTAAEWAREIGVKENTLYERLRRGFTVGEALTHHHRQRRGMVTHAD